MTLLDKRGIGFELIHHACAFFGSDWMGSVGRPQLVSYLLQVIRMHLVRRFQLRQLQVVLAAFSEIARLNVAVRQQFVNVGELGVVAAFLKDGKHFFEGCWVVLHVMKKRSQGLIQLGGIGSQ